MDRYRFSQYSRFRAVILRREELFMERGSQTGFLGPVTVFHERTLPERATPAGYAPLIDDFQLQVPFPRTLSATGEHHRIRIAAVGAS